MNNYIIINKDLIKKRIEECNNCLTFVTEKHDAPYQKEINILQFILSQSTPLLPEIEKAFDEGQNRIQQHIIEKLGLKYQNIQISQTTILNMEVHHEDYISQLKLDI